MPSWEQREIIVSTRDAGDLYVEAYTYGQLAIVPQRIVNGWLLPDGKFGAFGIVHVASGLWIEDWLYNIGDVIALVEELADMDFNSYFADRKQGIRDTAFEDQAQAIIQVWKETYKQS